MKLTGVFAYSLLAKTAGLFTMSPESCMVVVEQDRRCVSFAAKVLLKSLNFSLYQTLHR